MERTDLEPGFLQAFRLFLVTRIVFWIVIGPILIVVQLARDTGLTPQQATHLTLIERLTLPSIGPVIAIEFVLLVLLLLPAVPRFLGRWFVPVTLLISLVPLLVGYYWWPTENPLQTPFVIFFFVQLVLIAWQYPFRYAVAYVALLTIYQALLASPVADQPSTVDTSLFILQAAMMLIVGYIIVKLLSVQREQRAALAQAYEEQAIAHGRLQQYAATLEELTISRERNRLAQELHDTLAHSLSAVTVQLEAVRSLWAVNPLAAKDMLDRADETARNGLTEARRALQALRASPLQDLGLVPALRELAERAAEQAGTSLELHLPEQTVRCLSPTAEQGVYRIAQEALENIVRHAQAHTVTICLECHPHVLALTVEDDGQGLPADSETATNGDDPDHLGIRGMQERASLIGGQLEIASRPEGGTRVHLRIPVE
jgi:signal transduction histidine kinase